MKVAIISSMYDLETLLSQNAYSTTNLDLSRVQSLLAETSQSKKLAEEGLTDQVNSYKEKIATLQEKIANSRSDKESQVAALKKKDAQLEKLQTGLVTLRGKKEDTEKAFVAAQTTLQEKNRIRETIIIKTVLTTPKGSQTPAESAAESIIDKLEEVKNDARTQHSTSTTTVINAQMVDENTSQAVTEAKITGVKLISFINEGDSVKVKMAFRVRMELGDLNRNGEINIIKESEGFRFTEQTALDTRTGLMWARNGNIAGNSIRRDEVMGWVKTLNYGGYNDWRLPTKEEFVAFTKLGGSSPSKWFNSYGFSKIQAGEYLTSSTYDRDAGLAWAIVMFDGHLLLVSKSDIYNSIHVWPVREATANNRDFDIVTTPEKKITELKLLKDNSVELPSKLSFKRGTSFDHKTHDRFECNKCHEGKPGRISGFGKDYGHYNCKGCHSEIKRGPTACKACHEKPRNL